MTKGDCGKLLGRLRITLDPHWDEVVSIRADKENIMIHLLNPETLLNIAAGQSVTVEDLGDKAMFEETRIYVEYSIPSIKLVCCCSVEDAKAHGLING